MDEKENGFPVVLGILAGLAILVIGIVLSPILITIGGILLAAALVFIIIATFFDVTEK